MSIPKYYKRDPSRQERVVEKIRPCPREEVDFEEIRQYALKIRQNFNIENKNDNIAFTRQMLDMVFSHIDSAYPHGLYLNHPSIMYDEMNEGRKKYATALLIQAYGYFRSIIENRFKDFFAKEPLKEPECTWCDSKSIYPRKIYEYKGGMFGALAKHPNLCRLFQDSDLISLHAVTWAYHNCNGEPRRSVKNADKNEEIKIT